MLCTVIKRVIPVLAVALGYCQNHETSGNFLVPLQCTASTGITL